MYLYHLYNFFNSPFFQVLRAALYSAKVPSLYSAKAVKLSTRCWKLCWKLCWKKVFNTFPQNFQQFQHFQHCPFLKQYRRKLKKEQNFQQFQHFNFQQFVENFSKVTERLKSFNNVSTMFPHFFNFSTVWNGFFPRNRLFNFSTFFQHVECWKLLPFFIHIWAKKKFSTVSTPPTTTTINNWTFFQKKNFFSFSLKSYKL